MNIFRKASSFVNISKIHQRFLQQKRFYGNPFNQIGYKGEQIYQRNELTDQFVQGRFGHKKLAILGYGPQGRGQSLNLRDQELDVVLGLRKGQSWDKALEDGWEENKNLLSIEEACDKSNVILNLMSDAGQIKTWNIIKPYLENKTLSFSHGFGIVYRNHTGIVPGENTNVIMVAPKGPGGNVRKLFLEHSGINSSVSVYKDYNGKASMEALALGFGIGSQNLFETTFDKEVYSDLTGERCALMGAIQGLFKAQFDVLREKGHSRTEAFNETVEEALISLYPLINEKGMDWMFENCSTTAQRGAIDWSEKFYDVVKPTVEECYESVVDGKETERVITCNSDPLYRHKLNEELDEIKKQEIWETGKFMRTLR